MGTLFFVMMYKPGFTNNPKWPPLAMSYMCRSGYDNKQIPKHVLCMTHKKICLWVYFLTLLSAFRPIMAFETFEGQGQLARNSILISYFWTFSLNNYCHYVSVLKNYKFWKLKNYIAETEFSKKEVNLWEACMMAGGSNELIRPLTGLVFSPAGCHVTLLTSLYWWGSRFRRRRPVHVTGCTGLQCYQ